MKLKAEGIETAIGTWNMPMTSYFRSRYGYRMFDFPVSDSVFKRSLTLPLYEGMEKPQQPYVIQQILHKAIDEAPQ